MRAIRARYPSSSSLRRTTRSTPAYLQNPASRTPTEHAAIAAASAKWENEVIRGMQAFIGKPIPLTNGESLRITHVLPIALDETLAGWYNWRGMTNPDGVLLGTLVGGPQNGAMAAVAVDAKLSARSGKLQVMCDTLAQLLQPFQPLTNLVDTTLGAGTTEQLVLRDGFHVIRGVSTNIDTAAKSTRSLRDPEFAAAWDSATHAAAATPAAPERPAPRPRTEATRPAPSRTRTPRPAAAPVRAAAVRAVTPPPPTPRNAHVGLMREAVWALDALAVARTEMPQPGGTYTLMDVLALDGYADAPAAFVLLGRHGGEIVAQAVVLGNMTPLPDEATITATLAALPGASRYTRYQIASPFRIVPGRADTLAVFGTRRTLVLTA